MNHHGRREPSPGRAARPFTIYLPHDVDVWIRTQAAANSRTLTAETILTLRAGQRARELAEPPVREEAS